MNKRFSFIDNEILKENIAMKMQYVVFLLSLEEEYAMPGVTAYSAFKNIIIYTASIVEALIHYKLDKLIKEGRVKEEDIMEKEEKYSDCKELYKISETEGICGIKKVSRPKKLSTDSSFNDLNKAAKKSGLFTPELFENADMIRIARNRIHPYVLTEVDDKYSKKDINEFFAMASAIIERIEAY